MKRPIKAEAEAPGSRFTRWVHPKMRGYLMACCDCGLVHEMQFKAIVITKRMRGGRFLYEELPDNAVVELGTRVQI